MKRRGKIIGIGILTLILGGAIALGAYATYGKRRMAKLESLSFLDMMDYTIGTDAPTRIAVGTIVKGRQYASGDETFEIGSLTKLFTASLSAKAISESRISLDTPIDSFLDLREKPRYPTIGSLLTHNSGYRPHYINLQMTRNFLTREANDFYGIDTGQLLRQAESNAPVDEKYPWLYSNFGYAVLGQVNASAYNLDFTTLINDYLSSDLGLKDSYLSSESNRIEDAWSWKSDDAYMAAGALYSTVSDLLQFAELNISGEIGHLSLAQTRLVEIEEAAAISQEPFGIYTDAMAMGWILDDYHQIHWHNGATGNYNSYIALDLKRQLAVVILSSYPPGYRIPATVMGIRLMEELQAESDANEEPIVLDGTFGQALKVYWPIIFA